MYFSEDQLRETYSKFRNEDLVRIAVQDAESLTPEALQILKDEIKKRGLQYTGQSKPNFLILEKPLLDEYCECIQNAFCPNCNAEGSLNRIAVETIAGIVHFHLSKRERLFLCKNCSRSIVIRKSIYSFFLGIWTFLPFFIILFRNINGLRIFKSHEPSESLISFVKANYKEIEPIKSDKLAISYFINGVNARQDS